VDEESLAELQRRAYSRPGPDAIAAQLELAELTAPVEPLAIPELPPTRPVPRRVMAALLGTVLLLVAVATALPHPTATSLAVFDAPLAADAPAPPEGLEPATRETEDAGMTYTDGSLRFLGIAESAELWAWRTGDGAVCLGMYDGLVGGSTCSPLEGFLARGLTLGTGGGGLGMMTRTVRWGPNGDPEVTVGFE